MKFCVVIVCLIFYSDAAVAQSDSADVEAVRRTVSLSEIVVRSDLNVSKFLQRIKNDTSFYKAFRNLRVLGYTSLNDIRMLDKKGMVKASLQSKTRQNRANGCRTMEVLEEKVNGDMYDAAHQFNYYTAQLYAGLFFTNGTICGENNIVKDVQRNVQNKSGLEKHKEQLKLLFFNPGKKIPDIPFIGDKLDIFDPAIALYYAFSIDQVDYNGNNCYVFSISAKPGLSGSEKNNIVFDRIITWFSAKTMDIVARQYDLSYNTGLYNFDVHMEVQMTGVGDLVVPQLIRYNGDWKVLFKQREHGIFTATLFDFKR